MVSSSPSNAHSAVRSLPSVVFTVHCPSSIPRSAVCRLFRRPPSPFVYSLPHSLTARNPGRLESLSCGGLPLPFVYSFPHSLTARNPGRLEFACPAAVCRSHSFIRSPIR
jgi:hypothetical protein